MRRKIFTACLIGTALVMNFLFAQIPSQANLVPFQPALNDHHCGTMDHLAEELRVDPELAVRRAKMEDMTQQWIQDNLGNGQNRRVSYTIPVVFHVVYNTAAQNIPDSRLQEQLDVLNQDYRKLNSDINQVPSAWTSLAADCEVNFCLAQVDPNGNPTTGITRTQTSTTSFSTNDNVKRNSTGGKDIWDRNRYLNIWVCNLGGGVLGYAQFPGGAAATDGVVLGYNYVGKTGASAPYNKGRTATHEVGHWLNLYHIWGDDGTACSGSDQVGDTPNQAGENYGCPNYPRTDACTASSPGVMFMNYMDYTDDGCMYFFTNGQKARIQACLSGTRSSLANSNGCVASNQAFASFTSSTVTGCVPFNITFTDQSMGSPTSWQWSFPGGTPSSSASQNPTVTYNTPGTYNVQLIVSNAISSDTLLQTAYISALGASLGRSLPFTENFESNSFNTNSWTLDNPDNSTTWVIATVQGSTPGNKAAKMDYYNYNAAGQRDGLVTPYLNLSGLVSAQCDFQHAYRRYNNSSRDSLIIYISTSCGNWTRLLALGESGSGNFITGTNTTNAFTPTSANQWCFATGNAPCYSINLTPYVGNTAVKLKFEGYNNYGNNIYIDNINITGVAASLPPNANFSASNSTACTGATLQFNDLSANSPTAWSWNFGGGGTPNTSTVQNPSATFNTPGTYTVTMIATNAFGSDTATSTVTIVNPPTVSITNVTQSTCGNANGSATAAAAGGSGNYSYSWSNGQSGANALNLTAGTYTVTATDAASGCFASTQVTITTTPSPSVSVGATSVSCYQGSDGTAMATASGGTPPYTYAWNNGATTDSLSGLSAGTFIVTVTDSGGCISTGTAIVTQPAILAVTLSSTPETPPGSANGTATANVTGGTPPYTYSWTNGGTTQTITGLTPGSYTVTVTDANNCIRSEAVTVSSVVGIAPSMEDMLSVFPNPAKDAVHVCWNSGSSARLELTLYSLQGQEILKRTDLSGTTGNVTLSLQGISAGVYLLEMKSGDRKKSIRLRVE